jgi:hypothetical protein
MNGEDQDIHVMPDNDKHECSAKCWCVPVLNYEDEFTGKKVWVHKSEEEMCQ